MYDTIQKSVDSAREEGADICILLAHLGVISEDGPYTSMNVIANTTGIDAVLDGHSHSVIESESVKNKDGKRVKDILVNGEPLDPERLYTVSGNRYALLGHGDGHTAFDGANELPHDYIEDSTALRNFLVEELGGVVPDEYLERYGTDRIMLLP